MYQAVIKVQECKSQATKSIGQKLASSKYSFLTHLTLTAEEMRGTEYAARPNDDIQHSWLQQQSLFFQQAPAKKVNISIFNHHMISKLFARELYSKHHFAHSVLNIYTQNKHFYSSKHRFPTEPRSPYVHALYIVCHCAQRFSCQTTNVVPTPTHHG